MKYEEIQPLLDRYWEGETSLEEERDIKAYFQSGGIDPRLQPFAPLFAAFREEQTVQLATKSKKVAMRPRMYLWAVAATLTVILTLAWYVLQSPEPVATPLALQTPQTPQTPQTLQTPQTPQTLQTPQTPSIAQTSEHHHIPKSPNPQIPKKTQQDIDPETAQAMEEIKAALALVSAKLDKGRTQAIKGASYLDAVEKVPKRDNG